MLPAGGVLAIAIGYGMLWSYLHSDTFRRFLSAEASEKAGVVGEFAPFRWDGLAVETESFQAAGEGLVAEVQATGLHTEIGLGGLPRGVWEIRGANIRRLHVSLDASRSTDEGVKDEVRRKVDKHSKRPSWLPAEVELQGMEIRDFGLKTQLAGGWLKAGGIRVHAEPSGARQGYRAELSGGSVHLPFQKIPEIRLDRALLRYQDGRLFLTTAKLGAWEGARIEAAGEMDMPSRRFSLEGDVSGIQCADLLSGDWAKRLTGHGTSTFKLDNSGGSFFAEGDLVIHDGVLTALPVLDALAAYADTRRFRLLTLHDARTHWEWRPGEISLKNLVLASEGLVRLEGSMVIRGNEMDGTFRLGIAPGTLTTLPGAETDVFLPGERGLLWTTVRVTGNPDHPKEDLTERLITAAGIRMLEKMPEVSEAVIQALGGRSPAILEKGTKILGQGSRTALGVGILLDGILGGERKQEAPPVEEP
jgi:hypothetical protein